MTLNILIFTHQYYPGIGGVEDVVKSIAKTLLKRYYNDGAGYINKLVIITGDKNRFNVRKEERGGLIIFRWPVFSCNNAYFIPYKPLNLRNFIKKIVIQNNINIAHIHCSHAVFPVLSGLFVKSAFGENIKLVFSMHYHGHGHTLFREFMWKLWYFYVKKLISLSDVIHCVSNIESQRIIRDFPFSSHKIIIIPNGVNKEIYNYKWKGNESDYMLYAGRVEKYKNIEKSFLLLKIMNRYYNRKGIKLRIVGEGPYLNKLKKTTQKMRLYKDIIFDKFLPKYEYYKVLSNALLTINPSEYEAFSTLVAESLAIGTPSIVSIPISKIYPSFINNDISILPFDIHKILNILELKLLMPKKKISLLSWEDVVDRLMNIYLSL